MKMEPGRSASPTGGPGPDAGPDPEPGGPYWSGAAPTPADPAPPDPAGLSAGRAPGASYLLRSQAVCRDPDPDPDPDRQLTELGPLFFLD